MEHLVMKGKKKLIKKFGWSFRLAGFDALNYCLLAEGKVDAVIEANLKPYDILPLIPIIKNSGSIVTNWNNEPAEIGGNILATSNIKLHNKILKLLKTFCAKQACLAKKIIFFKIFILKFNTMLTYKKTLIGFCSN